MSTSSTPLSPEAQAAQQVLQEILQKMEFPATIETVETPEQIMLTMVSEQPMGLLIGKGGQTLNAIELLVRTIVQHKLHDADKPLIIDAEGYRQRHTDRLTEMAREAARHVQESGEPYAMEPMNARDRRTVHMAILDIGGLSTESVGEDPYRHIVVSSAGDAE